MQKVSILFSLFLIGFTAGAQVQTFWTEDFNNGCTTNCTASSYIGVNGAWTVTDVTAPGNVANEWFVSCAENGQAVGACGAGCGNNATLHVGNVPCTLCLVCPAGDCGAAYNAGPTFGGQNPKSDKIAVSPVINAGAYSNIILSFKYIERGQNTLDDATVEYSLDGGTTWNLLANTAKTANTCGGGQGLWTAFTDTLPAACNNATTLQIGFHWKNNSDGVGSDPSVAVDEVQLSVDVTGLPDADNENSFGVSYNAATGQVKLIFSNFFKSLNFEILDITGSKVAGKRFIDARNPAEFIYDASSLPCGIYFARLTAGNASVTRKLVIP
ncbi:MAG: T9SS type A sorting domain-containing protein [Bacteroidia bacterium]